MIPGQRQSSSPQNFNPIQAQQRLQGRQQQQQQQQQEQSTAPYDETHPAMIISHQPYDGQGFYPPQQQQRSSPHLANPTSYHTRQMHTHTIDPTLLSLSPPTHQHAQYGASSSSVKQEDPLSAPDQSMNDAYLNLDYDLGAGMDLNNGAGSGEGGLMDPNALLSPMSNSPLDDPDFAAVTRGSTSTFTTHGSGSLSNSMHSTPYGTPGMQMPGHNAFYSASMPVHATNAFGVIDHAKAAGGQPSSYSAYGPDDPRHTGQSSHKPLDVITEKRRRRRESHNAVERRRRDNINEKIQELASLLPDFPADAQNRPNKGTILCRSVDYIRQMQTFAMLQVDRCMELEGALRHVLNHTGLDETQLGLSLPLGSQIQMPDVVESDAALGMLDEFGDQGEDQDL
ncbi:hypothetical protein HKX48_001626 [Thoreauomyces humboldtii]|nr:hypothetical protein HKX48_001626 [Thoreauomyces humboldtii]